MPPVLPGEVRMPAAGPGASQGRILLIDDDRVFAIWMAQVIHKRGGYELKHVLDPFAGLRCVENEPWDLVITDVEMPGMSGLELIERVQLVDPRQPVAVMTAHAFVEGAAAAERSGTVEFLTKPVPAADLLGKIAVLVAKGRAIRSLL
jgi:two-component system, NtrC family, response regulator HydG